MAIIVGGGSNETSKKGVVDNTNLLTLWNKMKAYVNGRVESIELSESMTEEEIDTLTPDINDGTSTLPIATEAILGCVAVGDGLTVTEKGIISVANPSISKKLLWENNEPSSEFIGKFMELDLSEYDEIEIEALAGTTMQTILIKQQVAKGKLLDMQHIINFGTGSYLTIIQRSFTPTDNGITIASAVYKHTANNSAATTNNAYMIPLKIYGIKGVQYV